MAPPVLVLTGASRGIGLAIARTLLTVHGARVATLQRTITPELEALKQQFPDSLLTLQGDVAVPQDNAAVVDAAVKQWGTLNGLVLNAGSLEPMGTSFPPCLPSLLSPPCPFLL
jgi:NAD(P)-dependent dehydrogenase (short-subunit alcohol dehydrogenase family)